MSLLQSIHRGKQLLPPRIVLYGTEGIGKSTWAASAPKPIFIQTEDGLSGIDCESFPLAHTYEEVVTSLRALYTESHDYQTVIVDSFDWLERLIWDDICRQHKVASIEEVGGGYAKGYGYALTPWREVLGLLNKLQRERGMVAIGLAHSRVEKLEDPETTAYDVRKPRLHKSACGLVSEWADAVLFAYQKLRVQTEDAGFNKKRSRAVGVGAGGGERVIRTVGTPAVVAKNRYSLPDEIPLSWPAFMSGVAMHFASQKEVPQPVSVSQE